MSIGYPNRYRRQDLIDSALAEGRSMEDAIRYADFSVNGRWIDPNLPQPVTRRQARRARRGRS